MSYQFEMQPDGILYVKVVGDFTDSDVEGYMQGLFSYLENRSITVKLHSLLDASELGKVSPNVRRAVSSSLGDPRFGKTAVWGNNRFVKVLIDFLTKATGRTDMRYFTDKEVAIKWLHENK